MADGKKDIYVPLDLHENEISGVSRINGGTSEDIVMGDGSFRDYPIVPKKLADLSGDSEHRLVTDAEKATWNAKVSQSQIADFVTRSTTSLLHYYLKSQVYTKEEVQDLISTIEGFSYEVVSELPTASADTMRKIYLVPSSEPQAGNVKDEYITIDNGAEAATRYTWEQIGSTAIDLSDYVTTEDLNDALDELPVVKYVEQALTDAQKERARDNIEAVGATEVGEVENPDSIYVTRAEFTALENRVAAMQPYIVWLDEFLWKDALMWNTGSDVIFESNNE